MLHKAEFDLPPQTEDARGAPRTVGFELEFGSIDAGRAARLIQAAFGGNLVQKSAVEFAVEGTRLGAFNVRLDTRLLGGKIDEGPLKVIEEGLTQLAASAASAVVPQEIVAPPVRLDQLPELAKLVPLLREAGASGTEQSMLYAFALHINPEVPSFEARDIAATMKAYTVLSPWLWSEISPDMTRRVLGFAEPFDPNYAASLTDEAYWPNMTQLIDDYIAANPSRNRDLDPLPLFAYLDEDRVRERLPEEKINARPTFHYRLPDGRVSDPQWGLATEWNRWVTVERLAFDRERLRKTCAAYVAYRHQPAKWAAMVPQIVFA